MIDGSQLPQPVIVDLDLVGEASRADLGRLVLHRPDARIRSPLLERRADPQPRPRDDPPPVELPSLRTVLGPIVWVLVPGLPALVRVGWPAAVVMGVVALVVRDVHLRADRSTISFADGFLSYSAHDEWPHGVQEDNDVHWDWSTVRSAQPGRGASA